MIDFRKYRKNIVAFILTVVFGFTSLAPVVNSYALIPPQTNCCIARPPGPD